MRSKLPVYVENNDLPVDSFNVRNKRDNSYGYVNVLYLVSIIITVLSILTVIFVGKQVIDMNNESILDRYGENLTAVKYLVNPAVARDKELKELVMVLLTPEKSAVLVGKPGIGKTAIVEGLAYRLQLGDIPNALKGYSVYKISKIPIPPTKHEEIYFF